MLAGKAQISDTSPSMIRLFIEKQPKEIKIRLNNRSITRSEYVVMQLPCQPHTNISNKEILSAAYLLKRSSK
jgi:hypothetical protein